MTPDEPHPMNQNIMISNGKSLFYHLNKSASTIKTNGHYRIQTYVWSHVIVVSISIMFYFVFISGILDVLFDIIIQDIDTKLLVSCT